MADEHSDIKALALAVRRARHAHNLAITARENAEDAEKAACDALQRAEDAFNDACDLLVEGPIADDGCA